MPHLQFVVGRDVLGRPPDAAMPAGVVPLHHLGEHVHELQGVGGGQIAIQAFFEGAVEPFDDRGFGIPVGGKVVNSVFFQDLLKRAIVKFFALIRLQLTRTTRMRPFQEAFPRLGQGPAGLVFERFHPRVLGQHVQHRQQIPRAAIVFGQTLHFHQIGHPLMIHPPHLHPQGGKPTTHRFV